MTAITLVRKFVQIMLHYLHYFFLFFLVNRKSIEAELKKPFTVSECKMAKTGDHQQRAGSLKSFEQGKRTKISLWLN